MAPLDVFSEMMRRRICAVALSSGGVQGSGVGTGTVLEHGGELFVITCAHVARPRDGFELDSVVFEGRPPVPLKHLNVVFVDEALDLALLQIDRRARAQLGDLNALALDQLAEGADFALVGPGDGHGYAFIGLPWDLRIVDGRVVEFQSIAYRARIKSNEGVDRLTMAYKPPVDWGILPRPHGISGSVLFGFDKLAGSGLWSPGKAVAVEHSWNRAEEHLVFSSIAPIREFLSR